MIRVLRMFGNKTIDGVLSSFRKNISELEVIAETQQLWANSLQTTIEVATAEKGYAEIEVTKATDIANNIKKLIGE